MLSSSAATAIRAKCKACLLLVCALTPHVAVESVAAEHSSSESATSETTDAQQNRLYSSRIANRLLPFEPTYLVYQATDGDEDAYEVKLSFKYAITPPECSNYTAVFSATKDADDEEKKCRGGLEAFIGFNGEFDFYLNTRRSDPFLPRFLNPSLHLNKHFENSQRGRFSVRYAGIAVQHLSNGQTIEPEGFVDGEGRTLQDLFLADPGEDRLDSVGHGLNFVSLEAGFRLGRATHIDADTGRCVQHCWDLFAQYNAHIWDDQNLINWGPSNGVDEVADYFRYRFKVDKTIRVQRGRLRLKEDIVFSGTWTFGDNGVDDSSIDLSLAYPIRVPLPFAKNAVVVPFVEYHGGPLANLADYATPRDSWAFGLKFGGN